MKVLYYSNRKMDPMLWDISTPERRLWAFHELFDMFDEDGYYDGTCSMGEARVRDSIRDGTVLPADVERFMAMRRHAEYEDYEILTVLEPE